MVWCVSYSSLQAVDWSLYKFGNEGINIVIDHKFLSYVNTT